MKESLGSFSGRWWLSPCGSTCVGGLAVERTCHVGKIGQWGLESREQKGREAAKQDLVVVGFERIELGNQFERIGARERVRQRAHDEMQPPRELLARELRQRAAERGLEA